MKNSALNPAPELLIQPARQNDAALLAELAARTFTEAFGHLYKPEDLEAHLAKTCSAASFIGALDQGDDVLVTYVGDTMVGYAKAGKLGLPVQPHSASAYELHRLYVTSPYLGKGIAQAMMEYILELPPMRSAQEIYLGVYERNYRAQRFYARYGFIPAGEYTDYVGQHADREIIMHKVQAPR